MITDFFEMIAAIKDYHEFFAIILQGDAMMAPKKD